MLRRKKPKPPPASSLGLDELAVDEVAVSESEGGFLEDIEKSLVGQSDSYATLKSNLPLNVAVMASKTQLDSQMEKSDPGGFLSTNFGGNQTALRDLALADDFGKLHVRNKETPKSMTQITRLLPNKVDIQLPQDEALVLDSKEKLEHDTEIEANITTVLAVLTKNRVDCPDLGTLRIKDQTLPSESVEKVVAWALSHHLMNCSQPTVKDSNLVISAESITYGVQMLLGIQNGNKSVKKSLKDVVTDNDSEKKLLSDVIPSSVDDIGALENAKEKLLMCPLQSPEVIAKSQLTEPRKGILLLGPLKDEYLAAPDRASSLSIQKGDRVTSAAPSSSANSSHRGPVGYEQSKAARKACLEKLLSEMRSSKHKAARWSKVVPPGRSKYVDPGIGNLLRITSIRFFKKDKAEHHPYLGNDPTKDGFKEEAKCRLYLTIEGGHEEDIGFLNSNTQPRLLLIPPLILDSSFTIEHDGYFEVQFNGEHLEAETGEAETGEAERENARLHNREHWPLCVDVTAKVFGLVDDSVKVAKLERFCSHFYTAGHFPVSYRNINLSSLRFEESDDTIAHMVMRRSHGQLTSLTLGGDWLGDISFSDRVLDPLFELSIGIYMTKLNLTDINVDQEVLEKVLLRCSSLTDLGLHKLAFPPELDEAAEMVVFCCKLLQRFAFTSCEYVHYEVSPPVQDSILKKFVETFPRMEHLRLHNVDIKDCQLRTILKGWRVKSLDLSESKGFTGSFLSDARQEMEQLRDLILKRCQELAEVHLTNFISLLEDGRFRHLTNLVVKAKPGQALKEDFVVRTGLAKLREERPGLNIKARFKEEEEKLEEEELEEENSDESSDESSD